MHYFVDGYNLLFRTIDARDEFQSQRERFVEALKAKISLLNLSVTIIFDAQYQIGEETRTGFGLLQVIFTDTHITADECIITLIKNSSDKIKKTVVTSDRQLARNARALGALTLTAEEFFSSINKRCQTLLKRAKLEKLKTPKKAVENPAPIEKPKKRKKPGKNASFAECFDYYLDVFEEQP